VCDDLGATARFFRTFPRAPESAPAARRFVQQALDALPARVDKSVATLLTSEVVTNAILHTDSSDFAVFVYPDGDGVRIGVGDASPTPPVVLSPLPEELHGRGMSLVEELSGSWFVHHHDTSRKCVTFHLDAREPGRR
jgi:hypothetical protein